MEERTHLNRGDCLMGLDYLAGPSEYTRTGSVFSHVLLEKRRRSMRLHLRIIARLEGSIKIQFDPFYQQLFQHTLITKSVFLITMPQA